MAHDESRIPFDLAAQVAARFGRLAEVEAVVLAGSLTGAFKDAGSDIDLYVYSAAEVPLAERSAIARAFAARPEVGNDFHESGDEWLDDATGIHVDVMFRRPDWIESQLSRVLDEHRASIGYSTCFWHNVLSSRVLFDRRGWFAALQAKAQSPYPDALVDAVIAKNRPILRDTLSSYRYQIESAVQRGDAVSLQHRVAALLESYFDIVFSLNRVPHPGEKRLLPWVHGACQHVPVGIDQDVQGLLAASVGDGRDAVASVDRLIDGLDVLLRDQGR
jgi:Domain of unknown function (DUF4037)